MTKGASLLRRRLQDEVTLRLEAESNLAAYRQVRAGARSCVPHPAPQGFSSGMGQGWDRDGHGQTGEGWGRNGQEWAGPGSSGGSRPRWPALGTVPPVPLW